ncbi:MAG: deoxyribonuclease IV, partial [Proteobacteria bacterium]|nr:deoxyribonuclease IV [Pseudomonadota bacterium]
MSTLQIGAHMSIAGGLHRAFTHSMAVNATALQIFTRNQRQWKIPPLGPEDVEQFKAAWATWGNYPVAAHDSYLINLANPEPDKADRAMQGFASELGRIETLGIPWLVTHPGSHLGQGVESGIRRYVANLDQAIEASGTSMAVVLLETTAGQGTNLGGCFEELAAMIRASRYPERLGVCLDTCHVFAAGYDLRTKAGVAAMLEAFE